MQTVLEAEHKPKPPENAFSGKTASYTVERRRMAAWLEEKIKAGARGYFSEEITLTPVLAQLLLERNDANRPLSETTIEAYRKDLVAGRWEMNAQPLIVSADGFLNDGQHRCHAIIAGGSSARAVIAFGVSRHSRFTVDQQRVRTAGHYLGMNGHADANNVAAVAASILQWREHGKLSSSGRDRPTKAEILLTADHFVDIAESLRAVDRSGVSAAGGKSVVAFCHWAIGRKSAASAVTEFFDKLIDGTELSVRHPILLARNRLRDPSSRLNRNERVELIFRAWNAFRNNERPTKLMALNGLLPKLVR